MNLVFNSRHYHVFFNLVIDCKQKANMYMVILLVGQCDGVGFYKHVLCRSNVVNYYEQLK